MPGKIELLMNRAFPPIFDPDIDIPTFKFVSMTCKRSSLFFRKGDYLYTFIYMKNGFYLTHRVTFPYKLDIGYYLGALKSKLGSEFMTLGKNYSITVSEDFNKCAHIYIDGYTDIGEVLNRG